MADGYNLRGNPVSNFIFDKFLKPHKKEEEGQGNPQIPAKPEGMNELPPNINMTAAPIKNISEMKQKTPQEQYEHDVQMKNPVSAYARKEKEELKNLTEAAKEAGVLKDDADLASQTPAGEASSGDILPGSDGYVNPAETSNGTGNGTGNGSGNGNSGNGNSGNDGNTGDTGNGNNEDSGAKQESKAESRYKIRSIMDAYNEGILDEKSRDYLIVDTLSKFARNMGKDISNIGAAYTGGSQNNEREDSIWSKRNEEMAGKAIGAEGNKLRSEDQYDLDYQNQKLDLAKKNIQMLPARNFEEMANKLRSTDPTAAGFMDLIAAASTQGVDPEEYIAMAYANDPNAKKLVDEVLKAGSTAAGSIAEIMETVNGMGSDMKELTNGLKKKFNL